MSVGAAVSEIPSETIESGAAVPLLAVRNLRVVYESGRSRTIAVDGVSFDVRRGETLGLVGESGCGKSTIARAVLRLIAFERGSITFDGLSVLDLDGRAMRRLRRRMQIVFQDPFGSLNPRMRVGAIIGEPLLVHRVAKGAALAERVAGLLAMVDLPADAAQRFPHAFSGGQRQRIGIARALALQPDLIICDEPTSALDVSVQATILNLLRDLQDQLGLAYLFISHDMAVIDHMCGRMAVMRHGRIVEQGSRADVMGSPQEAYTRQLLDAVPRVNAVVEHADNEPAN